MDVYEDCRASRAATARFLRILEDVPRHGVHRGGVVLTSGTPIYTIKRILGTVPVEPDGSAYFVVPANRNVYFEVLDDQQREIQRMRSVVCLKPGERRTCIGCHESRHTTPPNRPLAALRRSPSRPEPPPWGTRIVSFLRDVQPVLNARCSRCHTYDRPANGVMLTDDLTDQFTVAYEELLPYLNVAAALRWDHPDDVLRAAAVHLRLEILPADDPPGRRASRRGTERGRTAAAGELDRRQRRLLRLLRSRMPMAPQRQIFLGPCART